MAHSVRRMCRIWAACAALVAANLPAAGGAAAAGNLNVLPDRVGAVAPRVVRIVNPIDGLGKPKR